MTRQVILELIGYALMGLGLGLGCSYTKSKIGIYGWFILSAGAFILYYLGIDL
ncbi:MAG: hypothetical protein V1825_04360 [Candidatus Falkowbacteria bacterium]